MMFIFILVTNSPFQEPDSRHDKSRFDREVHNHEFSVLHQNVISQAKPRRRPYFHKNKNELITNRSKHELQPIIYENDRVKLWPPELTCPVSFLQTLRRSRRVQVRRFKYVSKGHLFRLRAAELNCERTTRLCSCQKLSSLPGSAAGHWTLKSTAVAAAALHMPPLEIRFSSRFHTKPTPTDTLEICV